MGLRRPHRVLLHSLSLMMMTRSASIRSSIISANGRPMSVPPPALSKRALVSRMAAWEDSGYLRMRVSKV